jgi:hypothetical protein
MTRKTWAAVLGLVGLLAAGLLAPSASAQPPLQAVSPGAVYALRGTPHLWIGGDDGAVHWGGDTRALAGHTINWSNRQEVSADQLRALGIGDPWLSAGLLKDGTPIYQPKWETDQAQPTLLHIQSIQDVELFGINGNNYGNFVLDRPAWEQKYGFNVDTLQKGELAPAVPQATPTATAAPAATATAVNPLRVDSYDRHVLGGSPSQYQTVFHLVSTKNTRLFVTVDVEEWICSPACTDTRKYTRPKSEIGRTDSNGKLDWTDTHAPYKASTYHFEDEFGNKFTQSLGDDL